MCINWNNRPPQVFDYISTKEDFVPLFLAHLGTSAMMDLLLQMVAATPDNDQCRFDLAEVCLLGNAPPCAPIRLALCVTHDWGYFSSSCTI